MNFEKENYKIKLNNFEGPLDLLLHLIRKHKMDINDIELSKITEQYLKYLSLIEKINLDKASEFIEIAAILLEIKVKALLPDDDVDQDEEGEDKEVLLIERLKLYKIFKDAGVELGAYENTRKFYKQPDSSIYNDRFTLSDMSFEGLIDAFARIIHKVNQAENTDAGMFSATTVEKDRFTVDEKVFEINTILGKNKEVEFLTLIEDDYSKIEIVTVFLSILEMLKSQQINVVQEKNFSGIKIIRREVIA